MSRHLYPIELYANRYPNVDDLSIHDKINLHNDSAICSHSLNGIEYDTCVRNLIPVYDFMTVVQDCFGDSRSDVPSKVGREWWYAAWQENRAMRRMERLLDR